MMPLLLGNQTGLEDIVHGIIINFTEKLNAAITAVEAAWVSKDTALAAAMGIAYTPIVMESVDTTHMHPGHRPSLIEAPIDEYPNVSVMGASAIPGVQIGDHFDTYSDRIVIELMVKSERGNIEDRELMHWNEHVVNARATRMMEAVIATVRTDETVGGRVLALKGPPRADLSEIFTRRESGQTGEVWLWQGARLEFDFEKHADY